MSFLKFIFENWGNLIFIGLYAGVEISLLTLIFSGFCFFSLTTFAVLAGLGIAGFTFFDFEGFAGNIPFIKVFIFESLLMINKK